MEDRQRRKYENYNREVAFMTENAADFPAGSPGIAAANALNDVLAEITTLDQRQTSEMRSARMSNAGKDDALDEMYAVMRKINRAANAMEDEIPNIDAMFRMPRKRSITNLLTTARQFKADAAPHAAVFIEYGLPATFINDLTTLIGTAETAAAARDTASQESAGATGGMVEAFRRAGRLSNKLDSIVRIKYANNAQKLAAWTIASHLERAPVSPKPPQ